MAASVALGLMAGAAMAQDAVTLNVWSDTPRLSMFDLYDKTHDNVTLNVTTVAPADLIAKIQLALQAKSEIPDVIFMSDIGYTAQLSTRRSNYLLDLTDKVPQALQDEFYPNGNSPCHVNGKLLCMRNDLAHMIVWYDKPAMEALGKAVPTTWEEFQKLGEELAPQGLSLGTGVEAFPLYAMLVSDGCDMVMPVEGKEDTVKIDLTTEKCLKPARMVDAMLKNGSLTKVGPFEPDFVALARAARSR
jgi:ABC-type glycerol-3-phosphate transport system substrate-binding protein